ncbi:hypothetical protein BC834DRAFT_855502 [Gloeopeniophorella convolvens]|nr:hypothetical protein BC834DRAFT_855502 [Gloeopeniophorella convolvens]
MFRPIVRSPAARAVKQRALSRPALPSRSQTRKFTQSIVSQDETKAAQKQPAYLHIKIPDLSAPPPEPKVHIVRHIVFSCTTILAHARFLLQPFTPDFWESSRAKAAAAPAPPEEPQTPKIIVIGGADSARVGPTHILEPVQEHIGVEQDVAPAAAPSAQEGSNLRALLRDAAEDAGLPTDLSAFKPAKFDGLIAETSTSTGEAKKHTRTLDQDEVRGVWILLGLFAGSWLAGGLLTKKSQFAEHEKAPQHEADAAPAH